MTDRLCRRFGSLAAQHRAGLVAFVTGGEPTLDGAPHLWRQLARAGADILEIGLPADAWLDGPAIQAAHRRVRARGVDASAVMAAVSRFRVLDDDTPVVLMGYGETVRSMGSESLAEAAAAAGADGMLFIGISADEAEALDRAARSSGIAFIRVAFGDGEAAWAGLREARGFVYLPAAPGATGGATPTPEAVAARIARLRRCVSVPVVTGFGVRDPATFADLAPYADGIAVGSAFASVIAAHLDAEGAPKPSLAGAVCDFARTLSAAGRRGR